MTAEDLARHHLDKAAASAGLRCPVLAGEVVRYVGEPVAVVVAESRYRADDAVDAVAVEYAPLPVTPDSYPVPPGARGGKPSGEVGARRHVEYGNVDAAMGAADVVLEEEFRIARAAPHSLEPRAILAAPDPVTGGCVVWAGTQVPHALRRSLSIFLSLPERAVRVVVPDVGGAFGAKAGLYPEDLVVPWLAHHLNRPLRWVEDRREHFLLRSTSGSRSTAFGSEQLGTVFSLRWRTPFGWIWEPMCSGHTFSSGLFTLFPAPTVSLRTDAPPMVS